MSGTGYLTYQATKLSSRRENLPMISTCPKCREQVSIPPGVESAALVRCPLCEAEYPLSDSLSLAPPELVPVAGATKHEGTEQGGETAIEQSVGEAEHPSGGEVDEAAAAAERFPQMPPTARLRSNRQKSALRVLIEVVAGGLAGCLVAYYALAFYFGPAFNRVGLPILPLPFISSIIAPAEEEDRPPPKPPTDERNSTMVDQQRDSGD